mgnify:CR=1 FL=1
MSLMDILKRWFGGQGTAPSTAPQQGRDRPESPPPTSSTAP